jgi:putative spermidine/putrescine transport system ATP-binding protein
MLATLEGSQTAAGHALDLDAVTHRYGGFTAVDDVTLSIAPGEIVALLGPSGCGKTTLLRIVAGFVRQTRGQVLIDGASIDDKPPNRRNIGIVFQSYALFPHMTVAENVAYGLRARGAGREHVAKTVQRMLEVVQLGPLGQRYPKQLSGGQQQRVALARTLAVEPSILLLDEPFGALDKNVRLDMQIEVKRLQRQLGLTAIMVTHDQDEAMSIADRIAVMNAGKVEQLAAPATLYDRPASLFVNGFIGTTNLLPGRILAVSGDEAQIELAAGASLTATAVDTLQPGDSALLSIRPEQLILLPDQTSGAWPVTVGLSLPIAGNDVHDVRARDGTALKITELRRAAASAASPEMWCALSADARPVLFKAP